jgi:CheY-like chemotaxis protein
MHIGNAIKFTSQGEIILTVAVESVAPPICRLHFTLTDTGIGIPAERLDRLFQSFSQIDASITRQYGGTGLGLAICKQLVDLMGGTIWVDSKPGQGSTFHFIVAVGLVAPAGPDLGTRQAILSGKRLLIVAPHPTDRQLLMDLTEAWGMYPQTAQSGQQALSRLQTGQQFDLGIVDSQIANVDTKALIEELNRHHQAGPLPWLYLTPWGQPKLTSSRNGDHSVPTLSKPIHHTQLYFGLLNLLNAGNEARTNLPSTLSRHQDLANQIPLRILVAEDNLVNQKVIARILTRLGYRADIVGNGQEVIEAIGRLPYDLILMDVQMPQMDGLSATRRIRQIFADQKGPWIIAMTANAMQGDRESCLAAGMNDYISKPVQIELLIEAIYRSQTVKISLRNSD